MHDLLRRVADGMSWFRRMGRWEFGRWLGAMRNVYLLACLLYCLKVLGGPCSAMNQELLWAICATKEHEQLFIETSG